MKNTIPPPDMDRQGNSSAVQPTAPAFATTSGLPEAGDRMPSAVGARPEVWFDEQDNIWYAEIDYLASGTSAEEAATTFHEGWTRTVEARLGDGWYTPEGMAKKSAVDHQRFERELALSRRVQAIINARHGIPQAMTTTEQYEKLCDLIEGFSS